MRWETFNDFVANLFRICQIYQNRPSFVEDMTKNFLFLGHGIMALTDGRHENMTFPPPIVGGGIKMKIVDRPVACNRAITN